MKYFRIILPGLALVLALGLVVAVAASAPAGIVGAQTAGTPTAEVTTVAPEVTVLPEATQVLTETVAPTPAPLEETEAAPVASVADLQGALQRIYREVGPSVVNIQVAVLQTGTVPEIPGFPFGPQGPQLQQGEGSGWVWDEQGHIVTNNHVVAGAEEISVTFSDGTTAPATVVGRDPDSDLAVIQVDASGLDLRPVTLADSTQVEVGQFVVAIGNPFGLEGTMTFGIVSALGRSLPAVSEADFVPGQPIYSIPDVIQTDAPVNPGNSGGVLLDLEGRLIGVPTAIESPVRASAGVGFAVPSVIVNKVVPQLIETGTAQHPWLGISGTALTPALAEAMGLPAGQRGALVVSVTQGSPADEAGIQGSDTQADVDGRQVPVGGDIITAVDGETIGNFENLTTYLVRNTEVGDTIELTIIRDGEEMAVQVTLAARPAAPAPEPSQPETGAAWLGISGFTLVPELATAMGLPEDQGGVLVQEVASGSPADEAGLRPSTEEVMIEGQPVMVGGDVVVAIDDQEVATFDELAGIILSMEPGQEVTLTVLRGGERTEVPVTLGARPLP